MATIQLKHFGPITDTGRLTLTQVMLVIGRQSSGKSAFMKVLCYCRWLEKKILTSSADVAKSFASDGRFIKVLKQFYRIDENYFCDETELSYESDAVSIFYRDHSGDALITKKSPSEAADFNSKLSYIPAERNLVAAVRNINSAYHTTDRDVLFNFIQEWNEAKEAYTVANNIRLSVNDEYRFYSDSGLDYVLLPGGKRITSFYASSGIQSVMPIDVMSDCFFNMVGKVVKYSREDLMNLLMEMLHNDNAAIDLNLITEDRIAALREKMKYQSTQLFIEEPEQNLYPDAQRCLILNLIRRLAAVRSAGKQPSMVVMTTHSPYVLTTLNVLMADAAAMQLKPENAELNRTIDRSTLLPLDAYSAYFIDTDGCFRNIKDTELPMFSGIDLDNVSDWADQHIATINSILFAE